MSTKSNRPQVAVVGAGLSGMSCASRLHQAGWCVTVFEKSRGPGGRMSTRRSDGTSFDHGAQYFTARSTEFQQQVHQWQLDGVVAVWDGRFAKAGVDGLESCSPRRTRWVGVPGMNVIRGVWAKASMWLPRNGGGCTPGGELGRQSLSRFVRAIRRSGAFLSGASNRGIESAK